MILFPPFPWWKVGPSTIQFFPRRLFHSPKRFRWEKRFFSNTFALSKKFLSFCCCEEKGKVGNKWSPEKWNCLCSSLWKLMSSNQREPIFLFLSFIRRKKWWEWWQLKQHKREKVGCSMNHLPRIPSFHRTQRHSTLFSYPIPSFHPLCFSLVHLNSEHG